jgi:hypothetical protein
MDTYKKGFNKNRAKSAKADALVIAAKLPTSLVTQALLPEEQHNLSEDHEGAERVARNAAG